MEFTDHVVRKQSLFCNALDLPALQWICTSEICVRYCNPITRSSFQAGLKQSALHERSMAIALTNGLAICQSSGKRLGLQRVPEPGL